MQTLTLEGYLAADPSILSAQGSGKKRASFRVVETTRFRRANGEPGERTTGFNCLCFSEATAENYIQPYARKGSRVVIQGHVENDTWTGKDGVEHYDLRVVVSDLRLKNRRAETDTPGDRSGVAEAEAEAGGGYDLNDDIPF
jgi:single-strand DNA-binding protein